MSTLCQRLTEYCSRLPRHAFPFDQANIPANCLYILFEQGETGRNTDRIVRIGTHTGDNQLPSRLRQHFLNENKDRSIFRKNIGRAIMNRREDPYLPTWELDLTTRAAKETHGHKIDQAYQQAIEEEVSRYIQDNFTFAVLPAPEKAQRMALESKLVSTVSWCDECQPSPDWLGRYSTKPKIRESGLWQVNELYKEPLTEEEFRDVGTL